MAPALVKFCVSMSSSPLAPVARMVPSLMIEPVPPRLLTSLAAAVWISALVPRVSVPLVFSASRPALLPRGGR